MIVPPPWEGGGKVWYAGVHVLEPGAEAWLQAGDLGAPLAYGAAVTTEHGVICMGGSDGTRHYAEVFRLEWQGGSVQRTPLPGLPQPCAYASAALLDETIYVAGGQVLFSTAKIRNVGQFGAHKMLPHEQAQKRLGGERFRLAGNFAIINPKCVWDAILEETPYPVKMLFFISSNPVLTRANAKEVYRALEKVDFMAVADFFLTPTAELADIVLPAAT